MSASLILGLTDFLADGLQIPTGSKNDPRPFALALIPPTIFAVSYPDVFLSARVLTDHSPLGPYR